MPAIEVEIWSDVACPWCYIGKRKFEAGLAVFAAETGAAPVEVVYRSYELMPELAVDFDGDATDLLVRNKGIDPAQVEAMHEQVTAIAAEVGLAYDFSSQQPANTRKAHQLIHLGKAHGKQAEIKERMLAAHFVEGRHIGRDHELANLAVEVGIDRDEVLTALADQTYQPAVEADIARARELGISGVPFFVLDDRYGISGAQPADTFTQALRQVATERQGAGQ